VLPPRAALVVAVVTIVSRSMLSTIVALLLWSVLPTVVGFQSTTVMSGSMAPQLEVGDAVIVRHIDASMLTPGQVLLVDDPDHPGRLRMHRLVAVRQDGRLVTKGDANGGDDSSTVGIDAVHGAGFLRIPFAGLPQYWIRTGRTGPLVGGAALVVLLLGGVRLGRLLEEPEERERRRHRGVRLPGVHRATATLAALLLVPAAAVVPSADAHAAYSAATSTAGNTWGTACADRTPSTGATPALYYGYGPGSGTTDIPDLGPNADTGTFGTGSSRVTCTTGWSPYAAFDGVSGVVNASRSWPHPTAVTIATWFKVGAADAGGVLADFGSSSTPASSTGVDDGLYMGDTGRLTFGAASIQAIGLIQSGYKYCTTAAGYADGRWHLVVATLSPTAGCTITVDADPATTVATPSVLTVAVGAYAGYWRFGFDNVTGGSNAPTRQYFKGSPCRRRSPRTVTESGQAFASSALTESAARPSAERDPSISARTSLCRRSAPSFQRTRSYARAAVTPGGVFQSPAGSPPWSTFHIAPTAR
jgi:signal peptidase I